MMMIPTVSDQAIQQYDLITLNQESDHTGTTFMGLTICDYMDVTICDYMDVIFNVWAPDYQFLLWKTKEHYL